MNKSKAEYSNSPSTYAQTNALKAFGNYHFDEQRFL